MNRALRHVAFSVAVLLITPSALQAQCPDQSFDVFEAQDYTIRAVRVNGPLLSTTALIDRVAGAKVMPGAPVSAAAIEGAKDILRSTIRDTPSLFESPVAATVVIADVDACDAAAKQLDVVYKLFTTKIALALSRTREGAVSAAADPSARLAMAPTPVRYRIAPIIRYNELERFVGGARAWTTLGPRLGRLDAAIEVSNEIANLDVAYTGVRESETTLLRALEWQFGYHRRDRPTEQRVLHDRRLNGQVTGVLRPLGTAGAVFRFVSSLQAGAEEADMSASSLPTGVLAESKSGAWRGAAGVTLRSERHAFSGSYGIQVGFTRGDATVDYVKSIGDVAYDGRLVMNSAMRHRPIEIAARFGVGRLSSDGGIPLGERFFGGSSPVSFLQGNAWDFRANPVLRSFPASSFDGGGTGGDYFLSFNLTAAFPFWVRPLVPSEVSSDSFVRDSLNGQLQSAEQALQVVYKIPDPAHMRAVEVARRLQQHVISLQSRLSELESGIPAELVSLAASCSDQAAEFLPTAESISEKTYVGSLLAEPVDEGDVTLSSMIRVCLTDFNGKLSDSEISRIGAELISIRRAIADEVARIDVARAQRLAAQDMRFARGAVVTILDEMNAISLAPVFVVDVARLGEHGAASTQVTRYGVGTGVRLSLASAFHVTAGYTWNGTNRVHR